MAFANFAKRMEYRKDCHELFILSKAWSMCPKGMQQIIWNIPQRKNFTFSLKFCERYIDKFSCESNFGILKINSVWLFSKFIKMKYKHFSIPIRLIIKWHLRAAQ